MEGLQRSTVSFRRQGSSGLVWDDRLFSGELNKPDQKEEEDRGQQEEGKTEIKEVHAGTAPLGSINTMERSRSTGGGRGYRTGRVSPAIEPPSPKISACGCCGAFGKTLDKGQRAKPGKHRSR